MILETIVFTALPLRREGDIGFLSVAITPQLMGEEGRPAQLPLSRYPDFASGAWPSIVSAINWQVAFRWSEDDRNEEYVNARRVSPDPDVALFSRMFPKSMPVDPFTVPDRRDVLSFPARVLSRGLDDLQERLASSSPEVRPLIEDLISFGKGDQQINGPQPFDTFDIGPAWNDSLNATIDQQLARDGAVKDPSPGAEGSVPLSLAMLDRFLQPMMEDSDLSNQPVWPELDFHAAVSLLGNHPNLMRRLGFIVDLRVDLSSVRVRGRNPRVYAMTDWPPPYDPDATGVDITTSYPRVATTFTGSVFRPASRGNAIDGDFRSVNDVAVVTSDVEMESTSTRAAASALGRAIRQERRTYGSPERSGAPSRRSSGIGLAIDDLPFDLLSRMTTATTQADAAVLGNDILVSAEDLTVGYRIDVRAPGSRRWQSLHRRRGVLTPYEGVRPVGQVDLEEDEGWAEIAVTSKLDGSGPLRLGSWIGRWDGWSLSLPMPGLALGSDDQPSSGPTDEERQILIESLHGVIDYEPPASGAQLPVLRFSTNDYEFRLRWVDLAGNSAPVSASGGPTVRGRYLRHDPVSSPGLYLGGTVVWGESVETAVLRNSADRDVRRDTSIRFVAPPQVSAALCLTHGMFDRNGRPDVRRYGQIASRESASFPSDTLKAKDEAVPYLPDPIGRGLFVRGVPRSNGRFNGEVSLDYSGEWPDLIPIEVIIDGGFSGGRTSGNRITIGVPKGRVAHLRLSNSLTAEGLKLMDLWSRAGSRGATARAQAGAWWQLTPDRVLVAVHAVSQPKTEPRFQFRGAGATRWRATRIEGRTYAQLTGSVRVDQPSTQSVSFLAERTQGVDNGPGTAPPRVDTTVIGSLGSIDIDDPAPGGGVANAQASLRAPLPDTRAARISVEAIGSSRFAEYFRQTNSVVLNDDRVRIHDGEIVEGSVRVTYLNGDDTIVTAPDDAYVVDAAGAFINRVPDADAPEGRSIPAGTRVDVSFIPGPITRSSLQARRTGHRRASMRVPSAARPLPLLVSGILPTFGWNSPRLKRGRLVSQRTGQGLRVYLERPWFTSGIGEELAVVLRPSGRANEARDDLVSRWGLDPATLSAPLPERSFPDASHFTNEDARASGVRLAELDAEVHLVRYQIGRPGAGGLIPAYDAEKDMYYADINLDIDNAYRPFVRLALARYQPASVDGLELSTVSLVDVVQLEPDRAATCVVARAGNQKDRATVTLSGASYTRNELGLGPGVARLILERHNGPERGLAGRKNSAAFTPILTSNMRGRTSLTGVATWTGNLTLPSSRTPGQYRIVIEQFEEWRADGSAQAWRNLSESERESARAERLVHQDILWV